jgi:hypothetical protein
MCAEHSPDQVERLCAAHVDKTVFRFIYEESARLVAVALFAGIVLVWAAVLQSI